MEDTIRHVQVHELDEVNALIMRSKSYWDYDKEYLEGCRSVLAINPSYIETWPSFVIESQGRIVAFSSLVSDKEGPELDNLWVEPDIIRSGFGRRLFTFMVEEARKKDWLPFLIFADPFAEDFYLKMGAQRVGERESKVKAGFMLPLLKFSTD